MTSPITLTGGEKERIKALLAKHVLPADGYLKPLMDRILTYLQEFMTELNENRPLVIYDPHGNVIQRPEVSDYSSAIVFVREGLDGDQFHLIVPPAVFKADYIGPVGEQKQAWGEGFHTAFIATRRGSFFEAIAISLAIKSHEALASTVRKLDPETGPSLNIADVFKPTVSQKELRKVFANWLEKQHPDILLSVLADMKAPHVSEPLSIVTSPDAEITHEERTLALHYLKRDVKELWVQGVYSGRYLGEQLGNALSDIVNALGEGKPADEVRVALEQLVCVSSEAARAVNTFYAHQDVAKPSAEMLGDHDPFVNFKGVRDIPIGNFLNGDTRALPLPHVDFRLAGSQPAFGKLPVGPRYSIAIVGGGPASAFAAVQWAKIANYSGAEIELSIFEIVPDRTILGRFNSHVFPGGSLAEHGAMRFVAAGVLYWNLLSLLYGRDAVASTFPNHHVMNSRFMLHEMFGERGAAQDGTSRFEQHIGPVVKYVSAEFAKLSVEVDGDTITYQQIEDFLISRTTEGFRTPDRAATMLKGALLIDDKYRESFGANVLKTVEKGLRNRELNIDDATFSRLFAADVGKLTAADVAERTNVVKTVAQKYLEVGKGTGGWGSYFDMSVFQEAITRSINSTEEFTLKQQLQGVQEMGPLARYIARALGGANFTLHMKWGAKVEGLGKGSYDRETEELQQSCLIYRELDPRTHAPVGEPCLREFHAIETTVSPAVLAKTVAPQMGGTGGKVLLTGMDTFGRKVTRTCDDPFRVHPQDDASLDAIHPQLKQNNRIVWSWANFTKMFGTTKLTWEVTAKLYDQVAPRDPYYPGMALPVVPGIEAKWIAVPIEHIGQFEDCSDFSYAGLTPAVTAAEFSVAGKRYSFIRISHHSFKQGPSDLVSQRGPDKLRWLPVSETRLDEFGGEAEVKKYYGEREARSIIDGDACVWLPVSDDIFDDMEDDDPIMTRFNEARLTLQKAVTYVVPKSWTDEKLKAEERKKLLSVTTRAGGTGFYLSIPKERADEFEEDLNGSDWRLTTHETEDRHVASNDVYRLRSDGPRVGGMQRPGGTRNFYIIPSPDGETITLMEYNWDRDGHKLGATAQSYLQPDTASLPTERLGHANSFLFGGLPSPIRILTDSALNHATMNYMIAENYLGAFAMLGPGDAPLSFAVFSFAKLALLSRYNPENYSMPAIIPSGEAVSMNAGWINPALMAMSSAIVGHLVMLGGELENGLVEVLMGRPPFFSLEQVPGHSYPSFGLSQ